MMDPASGTEIVPTTDKVGAEETPTFGASFFLTRLAAFVHDHCGTTDEQLPLVHLHLQSGEAIELCHVITLAPRWVALDVVDQRMGEGIHTTRTEIIPYDQVQRITIRAGAATGSNIGFRQPGPPVLVRDPELAFRLAAAAGPPPPSSPSEQKLIVP